MGKNVRAEELGTGKKAVDNITSKRKQWPSAWVVSGAQALTSNQSLGNICTWGCNFCLFIMPLTSIRQVIFTCTENCQPKDLSRVETHFPTSHESHDQTLHLSLEKQQQLGQASHHSADTECKRHWYIMESEYEAYSRDFLQHTDICEDAAISQQLSRYSSTDSPKDTKALPNWVVAVSTNFSKS